MRPQWWSSGLLLGVVFLRVLVKISAVAPAFLPTVFILISGVVWRTVSTSSSTSLEPANSTELKPAIFFGALYALVLLVAVGAGADLKCFPVGIQLTGIDLSPRMLDLARARLSECPSPVELLEADVTRLEFEDESFDTVVTSCTFYSVLDPVEG